MTSWKLNHPKGRRGTGDLTDGFRVAVAVFSLLYSPYATPEDWATTGGLPLQEGAGMRPCRGWGVPRFLSLPPRMGDQWGLKTPPHGLNDE